MPSQLILRNGVYYVRMMVKGRRVWRTTGHTTLRQAEKRADTIRAELREQRQQGWQKPVPTVGQWVETYLAVYTPKKRSQIRDHQILQPVMVAWRHVDLTAVTPSMAVAYLTGRLRAIGGATANRERGTIQAMFQRALEEGLIVKNPWRGIKREPTAGARVRTLSLEHEPLLHRVLRPQGQRWLAVALHTGLRLGELCGLTEADVDFTRRSLRIKAETTKTHKAREIPMFAPAELAIRAQLDAVGVLWNATPNTYYDMITQAAVKAGISAVSPHDLRHSFATRYLQRGGDIYLLSRILGHSSVKMTETYYVHVTDDDVVTLGHAAVSAATTPPTSTGLDRS